VNLELAIDAATDAAVGISVRDEEDSKAVTEAFESGVETTDEPPIAALLDNRPSNHTPDVEGAFGLFAQKVPPIEIDSASRACSCTVSGRSNAQARGGDANRRRELIDRLALVNDSRRACGEVRARRDPARRAESVLSAATDPIAEEREQRARSGARGRPSESGVMWVAAGTGRAW
jgi:hypothetical protein